MLKWLTYKTVIIIVFFLLEYFNLLYLYLPGLQVICLTLTRHL